MAQLPSRSSIPGRPMSCRPITPWSRVLRSPRPQPSAARSPPRSAVPRTSAISWPHAACPPSARPASRSATCMPPTNGRKSPRSRRSTPCTAPRRFASSVGDSGWRLDPRVILVMVAALLMAPSLVLGLLNGHDVAVSLQWAPSFARQFRAGDLYPRWLPESFTGLGAPVFYFYPPLTYWIDALVSVATGNLLPSPYTMALARFLMFAASGVAMHAWLRASGASPRAAFWGAIAY